MPGFEFLASFSPTQGKLASIGSSTGFILAIFTYNTMIHLKNSPCMDDENIYFYKSTLPTSSDFPYSCSTKVQLWKVVASLFIFSFTAIPMNIVFWLKSMHTSPHLLATWSVFIFLWVLDSALSTIIFLLNLKMDVLIIMIPCTSVLQVLLGAWLLKEVFHYYFKAGERQEGISMATNEITDQNSTELGKNENLENYKRALETYSYIHG